MLDSCVPGGSTDRQNAWLTSLGVAADIGHADQGVGGEEWPGVCGNVRRCVHGSILLSYLGDCDWVGIAASALRRRNAAPGWSGAVSGSLAALDQCMQAGRRDAARSEEHTSELQSL